MKSMGQCKCWQELIKNIKTCTCFGYPFPDLSTAFITFGTDDLGPWYTESDWQWLTGMYLLKKSYDCHSQPGVGLEIQSCGCRQLEISLISGCKS